MEDAKSVFLGANALWPALWLRPVCPAQRGKGPRARMVHCRSAPDKKTVRHKKAKAVAQPSY